MYLLPQEPHPPPSPAGPLRHWRTLSGPKTLGVPDPPPGVGEEHQPLLRRVLQPAPQRIAPVVERVDEEHVDGVTRLVREEPEPPRPVAREAVEPVDQVRVLRQVIPRVGPTVVGDRVGGDLSGLRVGVGVGGWTGEVRKEGSGCGGSRQSQRFITDNPFRTLVDSPSFLFKGHYLSATGSSVRTRATGE